MDGFITIHVCIEDGSAFKTVRCAGRNEIGCGGDGLVRKE